jgi:RES domain-containing protein
MLRLEADRLPDGWNAEVPIPATQEIGEVWVREGRQILLSVPSSIIPNERNFVINPAHPAFGEIGFRPSLHFHFDPRLKK